MDNIGIILAAGSSQRFKNKEKKQFFSLDGRPIFIHSLEKFNQSDVIDKIYLVITAQDREKVDLQLKNYYFQKLTKILDGGETRSDSVRQALKELPSTQNVHNIFIHDAARPFFSLELLEKLTEKLKEFPAVVPAISSRDSVKEVDEIGRAIKTHPKRSLKLTQTPQGFRWGYLREAIAKRQGDFEDEAELLMCHGISVQTIAGEEKNLKITYSEDLDLVLGQQCPRVGMGYDIHSLEMGRPLLLGGVQIPSEVGTLAHSDGDILIHALCDALLGAAGLGDMGQFFPDTDPQYQGISSRILLQKVIDTLLLDHYKIKHVDLTVILEKPKIALWIKEIRESLASIMNIEIQQVSVKAKTAEKLGVIGQGKAIEAYAVATIM